GPVPGHLRHAHQPDEEVDGLVGHLGAQLHRGNVGYVAAPFGGHGSGPLQESPGRAAAAGRPPARALPACRGGRASRDSRDSMTLLLCARMAAPPPAGSPAAIAATIRSCWASDTAGRPGTRASAN